MFSVFFCSDGHVVGYSCQTAEQCDMCVRTFLIDVQGRGIDEYTITVVNNNNNLSWES